jgi:hypothetical protein
MKLGNPSNNDGFFDQLEKEKKVVNKQRSLVVYRTDTGGPFFVTVSARNTIDFPVGGLISWNDMNKIIAETDIDVNIVGKE